MSFVRRLLVQFRFRSEARREPPTSLEAVNYDALVRAHGCWIALLATVLERERVIAGSELAHTLSAFAVQTAQDFPEEGRILSVWASHLRETSVALTEEPAVH